MPKAQIHQRVSEAAKILDIEHLLERKPKALSGGQRQRVAVGRAIVREPAAFLFDEPLSNLDAKLRVTTRAELKRLHQRLKTTTIYVTHDQEEAMTLGDRIVVMKDGKIQQADTSLSTYNMPMNRFVAGFIGMPPMNFFDGVIKVENGQMIFEEGALKNAKIAGAAPTDEEGGAPQSDEPIVMVGEVTLPGNGFKVAVPERLRPRMSNYTNKHVVLGIRPEHFHLKPVDGESTAMRVQLNVIEPLGNDMDIYMDTTLHKHVVGRVEASAEYAAGGLNVNAAATVYVDLRKVHFFEPGATGMNLSLVNETAHAVA
jgi:multiple sugar transport system ATP-binding protein